MSPQAEALPRLCRPLRLAEGLCELVLGVHGRAGNAVPDRLSSLGRLTQLRALQLIDVAVDVEQQLLNAGLSSLTRLTRLGVQFATNSVQHDSVPYVRDGATQIPFPWGAAVGGLIHLQELRMTTANTANHSCRDMFYGKLPATLSRLTALRHLELLGMWEWESRDDFSHLQLAALPALETAALRLRQCKTGQFESLRRGQRADLSRLASLSLSLRIDFNLYENTETRTCQQSSLRHSRSSSWTPSGWRQTASSSAGCRTCRSCGAWCAPTCSWLRTSCRRASRRAAA